VRNQTSALTMTCFHGFVPNQLGLRHLDALFLFLRSPTARVLLSRHLRRYGGGLDKFEPNDLNDALVPTPPWFDGLDAGLVARSLAEVARGGVMADDLGRRFEGLQTLGDVSPHP
jgi:adenine-specific DNA-methyltransferase